MARKRVTTAAAGVAPRARGHRSLVTKRDLQPSRRRLAAELAELQGQRADLEESTGAGPADAGAVDSGEELAGTGGFTFERDLPLVGGTRDLIDKVEHALARIDGGRFGRCEACGGPIEAERLDALPYATLCLADARQRARPR